MTSLTPFETRLRAELMSGIARDRRRRARRRVALPAAACLALVVAAAVVAVASRPGAGPGAPEVASAGAVVVHEAEGAFEVTVADLEAGPDEVRRELAEAGITRVEITSAAVPGSEVGRFVGLGTVPEGFELLDGTRVDGRPVFTSFRIPTDLSAPLELVMGRAAEPGESYAFAYDAYGPGQPLHCTGLWGTRVEEMLDDLDRLGVRAEWLVPPATRARTESVLDYRATQGVMLSADTILFSVYPTLDHLPVGDVAPDDSGCADDSVTSP